MLIVGTGRELPGNGGGFGSRKRDCYDRQTGGAGPLSASPQL
jgi:hypothetical protein